MDRSEAAGRGGGPDEPRRSDDNVERAGEISAALIAHARQRAEAGNEPTAPEL
jgi:hypothetical protein